MTTEKRLKIKTINNQKLVGNGNISLPTDASDLTDNSNTAFTPKSHTHGNLQDDGKIKISGTTQASKNVVTDSSGKITTEDKPTIPSASSATPSADTTSGSVGTGTTWARSDHTHPKSSLYAEASHTHSQYLTSHQSLNGYEQTSNKVTSLDGFSTDTEYPSAKAVYDELWTNLYGTIQSEYVQSNDLSTVAFSNDYTDLDNLPSLGNLAFENDVDLSGHDLDELSDNTNLLFSGNYTDLDNKPTIPTQTSQLTNNSGFITSSSLSNYLQQSDVKDNLTSTDTNKPLSAKQGKELKTLVDGKANSTHFHSDLSQSIQNLGQTISGLAEVATSGDYDDLVNTPENLSDFNDDVGYLTSHQNISGKENISNKVTSISSSSTDTQYPSAKLVYDQLNNKAPTSHASSSTTYGVATSSNYGHTKVINNLTTSSNNNGEALSAYQGKVLNDNKVNKNDFNVNYVHSFPYNSSTEKYSYQGQSGALGIGVSAIDINDNSLLDEDGVAIIDLVFQNTNINYGSIQLVLAEADGTRYTDSSELSNTQTIATITDTDKHHITMVVSPDTHIEEQTYDYYNLKVSKISYDGSNITISSGKTSMEMVGVYLVFDGAIGGNIEYMNVIKRTPIVNQIIDMIYPVGSTYISVNSVNPSFLFGGQWEQIQDRFLLASGSTYSAGSTGGSATVTLTANQSGLKAHGHGMAHTHNHRHSEHGKWSSGSGSDSGYMYSSSRAVSTQYTGYDSTASSKSTTDNNTASNASEAHENMPPYLTVYMWKRIA